MDVVEVEVEVEVVVVDALDVSAELDNELM
jgi:hypothetical protein